VAAVTLSVLIVDDDVTLLRTLSRGLRGGGLELLTATDPAEALELLRKRSFDVILSDMDMPGMTGLELLAVVRREHPSTIRMMITADATTERALAAINEGEVARFFVKPVDTEVLRATLLSFRDRVDRVRHETQQRRERARIDALNAWAENKFPGSTQIARDEDGAIIVDHTAYDLVFQRR
jgi:two-component system probable response regulator PhcQ